MDYIGYPVVSLTLKPSSQTKYIRVAFESHGVPLDLILDCVLTFTVWP